MPTDIDNELADATFGSDIYPVASLLDPSYGLLWLDDYMLLWKEGHKKLANIEERARVVTQEMKDNIIGMTMKSFF